MAALVESMFSANRVVPWHGLGQVIEEAPDSLTAIRLAGLDWDIVQKELFTNSGVYEEVENFKANVRTDNGKVLGIVTDRYQILQNRDAFSFTDSLIGGGEVKYETAGSLKDGRTVWMLSKMNRSYDILGDKVEPYMCFMTTHDGTGSVRALMTPIRVVCQNTLNLAIRKASRSWSTTHVGDIQLKFKEAQRTLGLAQDYMENLNEEANKLVDIRINESLFREILNEVLPLDTKATERQAATIMKKREAFQQALAAEDIAKFRGTGWQVINAVSDLVTHSAPNRNTSSFKENRFASVVTGDVLFDKVYNILLAA